jgi:hypothetical protein
MTPEDRWQLLVDALDGRNIAHTLVRRPALKGVRLCIEVHLPTGGRLVVADKYRGALRIGWEVYVQRRHAMVSPIVSCATELSEVVDAVEAAAKRGLA